MSGGREPPPPAPRTGRETLASSGPHRSLVGGWKHVPVGKEPGLVLSNSIEPGPSLIRLVSQAFELLHGPSNKMLVDAQCEGVQLGAIEGPGRGRDWPWPDESGYGQPPAQIPACGIPALGSFLRCERRSVLQGGRGAGYLQVEAIVERGVPCAPSSSDDAGCGAGAP